MDEVTIDLKILQKLVSLSEVISTRKHEADDILLAGGKYAR
jgi:hypothetical protein